MREGRSVVILTGAGISAESGIQTFRGADGLWEGHSVEEVATPEGFAVNPVLVQRFYNERRRALQAGVEPNPAHQALARLEQEWEGEVMLVTQNVDDLHERGGSQEVWHMHGELLKARCEDCGAVLPWTGDLGGEEECSHCSSVGRLRPHVVWFGEMPLYMEKIEAALARADLFLSIGTSGRVYPAAGFVELAKLAGARTIEFNLEGTEQSSAFDECRIGPAGETIPAFVEELLGDR